MASSVKGPILNVFISTAFHILFDDDGDDNDGDADDDDDDDDEKFVFSKCKFR